ENHFMFQDTFYIQWQGTTMGLNVAPPYAVAYMTAFKEDYRFINDIFCVWDVPVETLLLFDIQINNIWPELKFTLQYNMKNISFLDTMVFKNINGTISTDLYTKTTDRNSLLHFTSFHPPAVKKSIPIPQFQRVERIVTDSDTKNQRLKEMEEKFSERSYAKTLLTVAQH
ncbi:unnamed protein product, partial [Ranitomeya imitator]